MVMKNVQANRKSPGKDANGKCSNFVDYGAVPGEDPGPYTSACSMIRI